MTGAATEPKGRWVVAASLGTGLLAGLLLAAAPFVPAREDALTGALLCGFALGWVMLAVLSVRYTDRPQRWAAVPAAFMGLGGLLLLVGPAPAVRDALDRIWPPALLALAIWMLTRTRRLPRTGRLLLYPVLAVLVLASVGGGYETVREAADAAAYPMPGRLVDVGGHRLHLDCTGSGSPTVVLEPGAGAMSANLGWITPEVARTTRVCVYDRAGRGWSDPADTPQDGDRVADDLHTLLHRGNVPGPYVLAGHSFGGLYALTFAARYPDEVAGVVLVDSTAPAATAVPEGTEGGGEGGGEGGTDLAHRISALAPLLARLGLVRASDSPENLPAPYAAQVHARGVTADSVRSTLDEYARGAASIRAAAALRDLAGKPLVVVTAGVGHDAAWSAAQDRLAALSTDSAHLVVDGATHAGLVGDPDHAAVTTRAILEVVYAVRGTGPLAR